MHKPILTNLNFEVSLGQTLNVWLFFATTNRIDSRRVNNDDDYSEPFFPIFCIHWLVIR